MMTKKGFSLNEQTREINYWKWLPLLTGCIETNSKGDDIDLSNPIVGVKIDGNIKFRVHFKGKGWQEEATDIGGDMKSLIDGIAIDGKIYQVLTKERWLPSVNGYDIQDERYGFAGSLGKEINK